MLVQGTRSNSRDLFLSGNYSTLELGPQQDLKLDPPSSIIHVLIRKVQFSYRNFGSFFHTSRLFLHLPTDGAAMISHY